jgi:hypothetical protein
MQRKEAHQPVQANFQPMQGCKHLKTGLADAARLFIELQLMFS